MIAICLVMSAASQRCHAQLAEPATVEPTSDADVVADDAPVARSRSAELVISTLQEADPQAPAELLRAVSLLQQIGEGNEGRRYIEKLIALNMTPEQKSDLYQEFGAGLMMRLVRDKDFAPEGRALAMSILSGTREQRRSPGKLRELIGQLGSESAEARRVATAQLAATGEDAVAALFDAIRNPPNGVPSDRLRLALRAVAPSAEDAIIAGVGAPDPIIQAEAASALGATESKRAAIHLIRPYLMGQPVAQAGAAAALRQLGAGYPSSVESAIGYLRRRTASHLQGETPSLSDPDGNVTMWTWNVGKKNIVRSKLDSATASAVAAVRLARDLYELSPSQEHIRLLLISRLEVEIRTKGHGDLPRGPGSAHQLSTLMDVAQLNDALDYSLKKGFVAGAMGTAEFLGERRDVSVLMATWSPLVRGLRSANRRVRYACVRAIMTIDPRHRYPGASYVLETLIDLARASGRPVALVGTPHDEAGSQIVSNLRGLGYRSHRVEDGKDLLALAFESSDQDVIFLGDSVNCPPVGETLQQLRKDPKTESIPVILMAREGRIETTRQLANLDDFAIVMPEFADAAALSASLRQAQALVAGIASAPATLRLEQSSDALQWLVHLAQYSQTYPWYDIMRAKEVVEQTAFTPGLSNHAIQLAGYLGGTYSQQLLVDTASQLTLPIEDRQRAANAFAEAVLRHGLLLRNAEVYQQYDRYNASKDADTETQDVLGQVLDIIETQHANNS